MHHARRRLAPVLAGSLRSALASRPAAFSTAFSTASNGIHGAAGAEEVRELGRGLGAWLGRGFATAAVVAQEAPKQRGWPRRLGTLVVGTGVVGAAAWVASGDYPLRRVTLLYTIPVRLARDVATAVAMAAG